MAAISFARGAPAPECLDQALIADCARAALERDGITILSYGTGGGYGPLRELLAERHGVEPGQVFLTTGGLQGFVFYAAVQLALRPGRVLVEGADLRPAAEDPRARGCRGRRRSRWTTEGLDLDALEAELQRGGEVSFLYTIPTFQNPSGRTIGTERRRRLVELAARVRPADPRGRPVRPRPLRGRAAAVDPRARGWRAGHLHVVVLEDGGPGLRIGYFVVPRGARRRLRRPRRLHVHLAEPPAAGDGVRAHRTAAPSSRTSTASAACSRPARTRCSLRSRAEMPGRDDVEHPGGWLLPLARLRRRRRRGRAPRRGPPRRE